MTPQQCKMARAAIDWSVHLLAEKSGVSANTISGFENGKDAYASTIQKLKTALESSGKIDFSGNNGVFYLGNKLQTHK